LDVDSKPLALGISTDPDHWFDLASLDALDTALSIAERLPAPENKIKWKAVGGRMRSGWKFAPAKPLYEHAKDVGVPYLAMVNTIAVKDVDRLANGKGLNNITFGASWQTGNVRRGSLAF